MKALRAVVTVSLTAILGFALSACFGAVTLMEEDMEIVSGGWSGDWYCGGPQSQPCHSVGCSTIACTWCPCPYDRCSSDYVLQPCDKTIPTYGKRNCEIIDEPGLCGTKYLSPLCLSDRCQGGQPSSIPCSGGVCHAWN